MFADTLLLVVCANNAIKYHNEFHDHVINSQSTVLCVGDLDCFINPQCMHSKGYSTLSACVFVSVCLSTVNPNKLTAIIFNVLVL